MKMLSYWFMFMFFSYKLLNAVIYAFMFLILFVKVYNGMLTLAHLSSTHSMYKMLS